MATFLLDTSVLIDTLNGKNGRNELLKDLVAQGHLLACCPINVTEIYAGMRRHEEAQTLELLQSLQYFPLPWPIARLAGELKRGYRRKGVTLATTDVTIAAVALYHRLTLVTDNLMDSHPEPVIKPERSQVRQERDLEILTFEPNWPGGF